MLRTYRTELRRSPLLTAFPVMIAVDLAVLFGRSRYWIGVWPEASAAAQVVTLFLGPMVAGVSAWQAGRASRAGMPEFLLGAARPGWRVEGARLAATLTLGFAAYAIGCLTAAAVSWRDAGPGFLWPSYLLLGASTLLLFASVGHLAGRWWPSAAFTPVICALGGFIALLAQPVKFNVLAGAPDTHLRPLAITVRLLLALLLAVIAVAAPPLPGRAWRTVPRRPVSWGTRGVTLGAVACSLVALAALPAAGSLRMERPAVVPECSRAAEEAPRVCVWPEHRKYLPELAALAERLAEPTQPWIKAPDTFHQFGLRRARLGDRGFDIAEGHVRTAAIAMSHQVFAASFGRCLPPDGASRAWQAVDNLHLWLEYKAMGRDPAVADRGLTLSGVSGAQRAAGAAARMSPAEQRSWVDRERRELREESWCEPDDRG
ncbi:ABC transporter permease [Streptomyces sp. NPDC000594]|uniref:DUF7224 domain-containing protein n=1 Tax=Streptomyces sp. NPDC000594 TaxID=3154261 RepID=UPI003326C7EB